MSTTQHSPSPRTRGEGWGEGPRTIPSARTRLPFPYWHELMLAALLVLLLIVAYFLNPSFVQLQTQLDLSTQIWELALIALPMTLIIITAGIDLSVGATMALSAVILGL